MSEREARPLSVRILEKEYHITCPIEERSDLLDSAEYLNAKMREIRDGGKVVGGERIAILTALNITHELLSARLGAEFDMGAFKRRMRDMAAVIDEAMSAQEDLF